MNIHRRYFLRHGGIALAAMGAGAFDPGLLGRLACAADSSQSATAGLNRGGRRKVLVCVFQRGAADGLSMVVPHGDPFYYKHRQEIAIPRPARSAGADGALDLNGYFGLHPAMDALLPLYKAGHLAIVHACGSPSASRSHFDMQDFMESAVVDEKRTNTGWLNRAMEQQTIEQERRRRRSTAEQPAHDEIAGGNTPFRAVSMTSTIPRSLQGNIEALAIRDLKTFGVHGGGGPANLAAGFEGMYDSAVGDALHGAGQESFSAISMLKKADPSRYTPARGAKYPGGPFGQAMLQVAQLIKANMGLEVAFVELDGWDTHANQGGAGGMLAGRLNDFSRAIAAFHHDLGAAMEDVLLLSMSEFGRAVRQNGNRGTDHGHGNAFFVLGGNVRGGKVLGDWPTLAPEKLFEERDLAVTTDFRDVFAEVCARHLRIAEADLGPIFPGYSIDSRKFRQFLSA